MVRWWELGWIRKWSQVDCVMDWTWALRAERDWRWFLGAETEHLGEGGRWREKGKARVLFGACHVCDEWPCFQERILPFTVELLFPLLCWETFSLRSPGWGHQWCHGEVPRGDVNLALCLHLGLSWLWLLTPLVRIIGLDLRAPRDRHPPASGLGIVLCAPFTPGVKLICYSRASNYQLAFNIAKTSQIMFSLQPSIFEAILFLFLALEL